MHEIHAINVLQETAREPFIRNAIENEHRSHENGAMVASGLGQRRDLANPGDFEPLSL